MDKPARQPLSTSLTVCSSVSPVLFLFGFLLVGGHVVGAGNTAAFGQFCSSPERYDRSVSLHSLLQQRRDAGPLPRSSRPRRQFRKALVGGAIGASIGVPVGTVLLKGALASGTCDVPRDPSRTDRSLECLVGRVGIGAAGIAFLSLGGPFGATRRAGLEPSVSVYFPSAFSQILLGGVAYSLGSTLGRNETGRTAAGIAVGVPFAILGAAGGAVLGADRDPTSSNGLVAVEGSDVRLGTPDVRVRTGVFREGATAVDVTLVSVEL